MQGFGTLNGEQMRWKRTSRCERKIFVLLLRCTEVIECYLVLLPVIEIYHIESLDSLE